MLNILYVSYVLYALYVVYNLNIEAKNTKKVLHILKSALYRALLILKSALYIRVCIYIHVCTQSTAEEMYYGTDFENL